MNRDKFQRRIYDWAKATFGDATMVRGERVRRFLEEAIELAQAEGIPQHDVDKLAAYVYSKPPGTPEQELGGVGLTMLAYAETAGLSSEDCETEEFERVQKKDVAHFRERHNKKADAGVAVRAGEDRRPPYDLHRTATRAEYTWLVCEAVSVSLDHEHGVGYTTSVWYYEKQESLSVEEHGDSELAAHVRVATLMSGGWRDYFEGDTLAELDVAAAEFRRGERTVLFRDSK